MTNIEQLGDETILNTNELWLIADTHFNHEKILEYEPIRTQYATNVADMNRVLMDNWNSSINDKDVVLFLGDFSIANSYITKLLVSQLKGQKVMVMGNHDRRSKTYWKKAGFVEVYDRPIVVRNVIFSHALLSTQKC